MITIIKKKYKGHSRTPISEIKKQRHLHKKDLIQPRIGGEVNPKFLKEYGAKNIRISEHDIRKMESRNPRFARKLAEDFKKQNADKN
ncbi:MAG TPA: hypothetical protein ENI23_04785 [bacterium]|nr:hypothetical protein [bacterium]